MRGIGFQSAAPHYLGLSVPTHFHTDTTMSRFATLPFTLRRSEHSFTSDSMTTTTEKVHGLLRLEGDELTVQWRLARKTETLGGQAHHTDEDIEAVREAKIQISGMAGAIVQRPWWRFWSGPRIVLLASDLQALEAVAGEDGLRLAHPAKLVLTVRRSDALVAAEFAAELEIAVAEGALARSDEKRRLVEKSDVRQDPVNPPTE